MAAELLLLALYAALYPTLLAVVVILLAQARPRRLLTVYLIGGMSMSIGAGLLIVFVLFLPRRRSPARHRGGVM